MEEILIEVRNLKKYFELAGNTLLKAVDDITFVINKGETLGIVGESGCGKSTLGRCIIGLYDATAGEVRFKGENIHRLNSRDRFASRRNMAMIFQDPYASLNPRMSVADIIAEPMEVHQAYSRKERREKVFELLESVGLNREHADRYPHEFSGGQRQRIGIARALALDPEFIICDEPISALDVSVQAQVVNLLKKLQKEKGFTYLFIAHDLSMVRQISDKIAVMYLGHLVEKADSEELNMKPLHPYTQALLSAIPVPDPDVEDARERIILEGELPSPTDPPSGCVFRTRCRFAMDVCSKQKPDWLETEKNHHVKCHLYDEAIMTIEERSLHMQM